MASDDPHPLSDMAMRLAEAIKRAGGHAVVAREAPVPASTLNRYVKAQSEPPALTLGRIANACNVTVDWLVFGHSAGSPAAIERQTSGPLVLHPSPELGEDYVRIPRFDVRASAGKGRDPVPSDMEIRSEIAFRTSWLRTLSVQPEFAQFLTADGDSMEPTIQDGDLLLINRNIDRVVQDAIYVVVLAGAVMVKRLQLLFDGSILLISDNPRYQPERVDKSDVERLQIEGLVRWFGRAI